MQTFAMGCKKRQVWQAFFAFFANSRRFYADFKRFWVFCANFRRFKHLFALFSSEAKCMIVLMLTFFACLTFSLLNRKHGRSYGRQTEERWKEGTRFGGGWEMVVEPSSLIGIIGGELVG